MLDALHDTEHDPDVSFFDDPAREDELWEVREAGLGATAHVPGQPRHLRGLGGLRRPPGPARGLPARPEQAVRRVRLRDETGPSLYGHFGQGCVHTRIPFDLYTHRGRAEVPPVHGARRRPGRLATAGSLSGEHGDGQSRGELLDRMFGEELVAGVRRGQGTSSTRRPDEPGQGRPPGRAGRAPPARRRLGARRPRRTCSSAIPTTAARSPRRPTAASASASAASTTTTAAP